MIVAIVCPGPQHAPGTAPVIATRSQAAPLTPPADAGMLCAECGAVYAEAVARAVLPAGLLPSAALVADTLPQIMAAQATTAGPATA